MDKEDMNQDVEEEGISLKEIWLNIKKHLVAIVAIILIFIAGGIGFDAIKKPEYKSKATFLVQYESRNDSMNSDYQFSRYILNTYVEFIKKDIVLEPVSKEFDIPMNELRSNLSVSSSGDSLILDISYVSKNNELSKNILISIVKQTIKVTNQTNADGKPEYTMLYNNLKVLSDPCLGIKVNKTLKYISIFFLFGVLVSGLYVLIMVLTDNRFKSNQEIENVLGLPVLACIPKYVFEEHKNGGN